MSRRDEELFPAESQGIAIGLLSGAVIGAAAAIFLSSKTGGQVKAALCEACGDIAERSSHLTDALSEKFTTRKRSNDNLNMIVGGIAGSILGVTAILFLGSDAARDLRKNVRRSINSLAHKGQEIVSEFSDKAHESYDSAGEQIASWAEAAQEFLGKHQKRSHQEEESFPEKALHWTLLGIRLYQSLKKER